MLSFTDSCAAPLTPEACPSINSQRRSRAILATIRGLLGPTGVPSRIERCGAFCGRQNRADAPFHTNTAMPAIVPATGSGQEHQTPTQSRPNINSPPRSRAIPATIRGLLGPTGVPSRIERGGAILARQNRAKPVVVRAPTTTTAEGLSPPSVPAV